VFRSSCRSIMLRQKKVAFVKALSTMQLSPAILKELRMDLSRRKKKPVVPAGIRSTTSASGARTPHRLPSLLAGKRKANELASSGDSSEPANRRPAPGAGSAPLPAVTGEHAASCSRHLVSPRGRGDVRGCLGRVCRPSSAKWAAQAHSHGFRPV